MTPVRAAARGGPALRRTAALAAVAIFISGVTHAQPQTTTTPTLMDRAEARELLDQLVAMPTFKGNGQVPVLAAELSRRLREAGFAEDQIQLLAMDANGNATAALVVRYAGRSGSDRAPIALLGHMDVVEAIADNWASDPFTATEKDGYLYGRGVVDNKAQVSLLVTTLMRLKRAGWVPDRDLVLALSGDEESGSHTTRC